MKAIKLSKSPTKDRKLGDEWETWNGEISDPEGIRVGNRLFLVLLSLSILMFMALAYFGLYLIAPRLSQYSARLPVYLFYLISILSGIAILGLLGILVVIKTDKGRFCFCLGNRFFLAFAGIAHLIGNKLGFSRDKVGHSFIEVSNALTLASLKQKEQCKVLVLLPRCLTREARNRTLEICSRFDVRVETVSGGEAARTKVSDLRPDAVVGIACERDLVSGIQDVASEIPVFGIPNIRPNGPCKATHIDFKDLEDTLRFIYDSSL